MDRGTERRDFYVSCAEADRRWGEWVASQLTDAGFDVDSDDWEKMEAPTNWRAQAEKAIRSARATVAVVSRAYLDTVLPRIDWPDGSDSGNKLLVLLIEDCQPTGPLRDVVPVRLHGFRQQDRDEASRLLRNGARRTAGREPALPVGPAAQAAPDRDVEAPDDPRTVDSRPDEERVRATVEAALRQTDPFGPDGENLDRYLELAVFPAETAVDIAVLEAFWSYTAGWNPVQVSEFCDRLGELHLVERSPAASVRPGTAASVVLPGGVHRFLYQRAGGALPAPHRRLVEACRARLRAEGPDGTTTWWELAEQDADLFGYLAGQLVRHLLGASLREEASALARDPRWIAATLRRTGSTLPAERDLASVAVGDGIPQVLARALARDAHVLTGPALPGGLGPTLAAALAAYPELAAIAASYGATLATPRLDLVWSTHSACQAHLRTVASEPVNALAFTSDDGAPAVAGGDQVLAIAAGDDGTVRWLDPATGADRPRGRRAPGGAPADKVNAVAFAPVGSLVALGGADGAVRLWDPVGGEPPRALSPAHERGVSAVVFAPARDGRGLLATASYDGTAHLWDPTSDTRLTTLPVGSDVSVNAVAFSPEGRLIITAASDGLALLWDLVGPAPVLEQRAATTDAPMGVNAVAFDPARQLVALGCGDGRVLLWDPETSERHELPAHDELGVVALAFSSGPRGGVLATAGGDRTVRLWDPATRTPLATLTGHGQPVTAMVFSDDGSLLATGDTEGTVRLWDPGARPPAQQPDHGYSGPMSAVAFSPDGRRLAACRDDGTVRLWDLRATDLRPPGLGNDLPAAKPGNGHEPQVTALAFSPRLDHPLLATAGTDWNVRLWNPATRTAARRPLRHPAQVTALAFSADGRMLATADADRQVRLWNPARGTRIGAPLAGHREPVGAVAFSPSGGLLATADKQVRLWDLGSGKQCGGRFGHDVRVTAMAFSPGGGLLATASQDGTARLWDPVGDNRLLGKLTGHSGPVTAVAFCPDDDSLLATGGADQTVRLWRWAHATSAATAVTAVRLGAEVTGLSWNGDLLCCATGLGLRLLRCRR